jgi:hypothetical protein
MDTKLYDRIVEYAKNIRNGGELPWQGLYTARSVYEILRKSEIALSPEEISNQLEISSEYINQIILALQNGGIRVKSEPGDKSWTGRPKSKYYL